LPNIRLIIEYDGSGFSGWQSQLGQRTIEAELKRTLETVLRQPLRAIYASGRTDAGVHARGQVVNFFCEGQPDLSRLARAVSSILRRELTVHRAEIVPDEFHARHSAVSKQYSYTFYNRECPPVLDRGRVWFIPRKLDLKKMQAAAKSFVGQHDFTSFQDSECSSKDPVKTIYESELVQEPPYIKFRVVGSGFLKQMVRNMAGTLVGIGDGRITLSIEEILQAKDRRVAGVTAPGFGLCLDWVCYSAPSAEKAKA